MKKLFVLMLCVMIGMFAAVASADVGTGYIVGDGVPNSAHDLSSGAYLAAGDTIGGRICIFCHAPHNTIRGNSGTDNTWLATGTNTEAPSAYTYLPLWNHQVTATNFTMYYNGTGSPTGATSTGVNPRHSQAIDQFNLNPGTQPGGVSLLCLSCHDGTVAVNVFGTAALSNAIVAPTGSYNQGTTMIDDHFAIGKNGDLQNHHPIGFDYDLVASVDTGIRPSTEIMDKDGGSIADHLFTNASAPGACTSACVECATCHSVHNKGNIGERLLWRSDEGSRLCLTCHAKDGNVGAPPVGIDFGGVNKL